MIRYFIIFDPGGMAGRERERFRNWEKDNPPFSLGRFVCGSRNDIGMLKRDRGSRFWGSRGRDSRGRGRESTISDCKYDLSR